MKNAVRFFMVPNGIFDLELKSSEMLILMYMFRVSDSKLECFPSYNTIERNCKLSRSTVINGVKNLIKKGLVEKVKHGHNSYDINCSNLYRLTNIFEFNDG